jgi:hypothetical protein
LSKFRELGKEKFPSKLKGRKEKAIEEEDEERREKGIARTTSQTVLSVKQTWGDEQTTITLVNQINTRPPSPQGDRANPWKKQRRLGESREEKTCSYRNWWRPAQEFMACMRAAYLIPKTRKSRQDRVQVGTPASSRQSMQAKMAARRSGEAMGTARGGGLMAEQVPRGGES